jgi:hypothetical protein
MVVVCDPAIFGALLILNKVLSKLIFIHKMTFVNLPDSVLSGILSGFADLKDLTRFDSSLTNNKNRSVFLAFLAAKESSFSTEGCINKSRLSWINLRCIKLSHINLYSDCFNKENQEIIFHFDSSKVINIRIDTSLTSQEALNMVNYCPNVSSLNNFSAFYEAEGMKAFFEQIDTKIMKQLTFISDIFGVDLFTLSERCESLTSLNIQNDIRPLFEFEDIIIEILQKNPKITQLLLREAFSPTFYSQVITLFPQITIFSARFEIELKDVSNFTSCHLSLSSVNIQEIMTVSTEYPRSRYNDNIPRGKGFFWDAIQKRFILFLPLPYDSYLTFLTDCLPHTTTILTINDFVTTDFIQFIELLKVHPHITSLRLYCIEMDRDKLLIAFTAFREEFENWRVIEIILNEKKL